MIAATPFATVGTLASNTSFPFLSSATDDCAYNLTIEQYMITKKAFHSILFSKAGIVAAIALILLQSLIALYDMKSISKWAASPFYSQFAIADSTGLWVGDSKEHTVMTGQRLSMFAWPSSWPPNHHPRHLIIDPGKTSAQMHEELNADVFGHLSPLAPCAWWRCIDSIPIPAHHISMSDQIVYAYRSDVAFGWPLRWAKMGALWLQDQKGNTHTLVYSGIDTVNSGAGRSVFDLNGIIPARINWLHLLLSIVAPYMLYVCLHLVIRLFAVRSRTRRGACVNCGYLLHITSLVVCPECGCRYAVMDSPRPHWPPSA